MSDAAQIPHPAKGAADEARSQLYGVLPWRIGRRGALEVVLITSLDGEDWTLPKCGVKVGRSPARSARREAFRQAGVIGEMLDKPIGGYRAVDESAQPREVTLFTLRVSGTLLNWPERHQRQRSWRFIGEAADLVAEPDLANLLRSLQHNPQGFG